MHKIKYSDTAKKDLNNLKTTGQAKKLAKIKNAVKKLEENPKHPGLHTHKNSSVKSPFGGETFQSYVENKTPGAFRIFWCYGPDKSEITIFAITQHT
ncbi:MAG: hypothetical protein WCG23_11595 [bacterium]